MSAGYSDWIITIPRLVEKDLFPSFSDGCNVRESVALFNDLFMQAVGADFPGAWVDQASRFDIQSPDDATDSDLLLVRAGLIETMRRVIMGDDWRIPS